MVYRENQYNPMQSEKNMPYTQNNLNPVNKTSPAATSKMPEAPQGGSAVSPAMSSPNMNQGLSPAMTSPNMNQGLSPVMTSPNMNQGLSPAMTSPNMNQGLSPAMKPDMSPAMKTATSPSMNQGLSPAMKQGMSPSMMQGMTPSMSQGMTMPSSSDMQPFTGGSFVAPASQQSSAVPQTVQNPYYTAGFLKKYIGRDVRVEFLVGSSGPLVDRIGTLLEVGASYILIRPVRSNDQLMCDLYSIKFVTIYG